MICPRCKTEMNDDMTYCPQCGMKIEKCPACHQPVIQGAKFCSHCGAELNRHYQESQIEGYYQPIEQSQQERDHQSTAQQTSFQDIPANHKMNKKVIIICVVTLVIVTFLSYIYIYKGPGIANMVKEEPVNELTPEPIEVNGTTTFATHTGNINNQGHAFLSADRIYMTDDNGYLISMNKKFEDRKTLVSSQCEYLNVVGNIIYYTNEKHQLSSVTTDGKDQKVIFNKEIYYLIIKDNRAYYQSQDGDLERIYVYDLKTNKETRLNDRPSYCLNVLDDKIYYTSTDGIYSMNKDGSGDEKLINDKVYSLVAQDQKLYYFSENKQIMVYDLNNPQTKTVIEDASFLINITAQYIFYIQNNQVMKYDLKTNQSTKIYSGSITSGQIIGDKMILSTESSPFNQTEDNYQIIIDFDGNHQQRLFTKNNGSYI